MEQCWFFALRKTSLISQVVEPVRSGLSRLNTLQLLWAEISPRKNFIVLCIVPLRQLNLKSSNLHKYCQRPAGYAHEMPSSMLPKLELLKSGDEELSPKTKILDWCHSHFLYPKSFLSSLFIYTVEASMCMWDFSWRLIFSSMLWPDLWKPFT